MNPIRPLLSLLQYFNNRLSRGFFFFSSRKTPKPPRRWTAPLMLLATIISTVLAGTLTFGTLMQGVLFSFSLLLILGAHEIGHFLAARIWKVPASLPYFIPFPPPLSLIGTLGAVIRLRAPITERKALFDIGAAGPLAGWIVTLFFLGLGYMQAQVFTSGPPDGEGMLEFGSSLLMLGIEKALFGSGAQVMLNPFLYAAWVGMLVTALNLMPLGQLDGGHILHALFPEFQGAVGKIFFAALIALSFWWSGWILWAVLALVFGVAHPSMDDREPLGMKRQWIGFLVIFIFILTFIPVPVTVN